MLLNIEDFNVCVMAPIGDHQGVLKNVNVFFSSIAIKLFAISACMSKQHCLHHNLHWPCYLCCHQAAVIFKLACSWLVQKIDRILKRKCLNEQTHSRALRDSMQKKKKTQTNILKTSGQRKHANIRQHTLIMAIKPHREIAIITQNGLSAWRLSSMIF